MANKKNTALIIGGAVVLLGAAGFAWYEYDKHKKAVQQCQQQGGIWQNGQCIPQSSNMGTIPAGGTSTSGLTGSGTGGGTVPSGGIVSGGGTQTPSPAQQCAAIGGTWNGSQCVLPSQGSGSGTSGIAGGGTISSPGSGALPSSPAPAQIKVVGASVNNPYPSYGQGFTVTLQLQNTGGKTATVYVYGKVFDAGTTSPQQGAFYQVGPVTIAPGQTVSVQVPYSGTLVYANQLDWTGSTNPGWLDALFGISWNDGSGSQTIHYTYPNVVRMPQQGSSSVGSTASQSSYSLQQECANSGGTWDYNQNICTWPTQQNPPTYVPGGSTVIPPGSGAQAGTGATQVYQQFPTYTNIPACLGGGTWNVPYQTARNNVLSMINSWTREIQSSYATPQLIAQDQANIQCATQWAKSVGLL